jgi:hypothetical protein
MGTSEWWNVQVMQPFNILLGSYRQPVIKTSQRKAIGSHLKPFWLLQQFEGGSHNCRNERKN